MNNYDFFLRLITLFFGFSAIITSLIFYFQLKKPLALYFAGFLGGVFMQLLGDFITYLGNYTGNLWMRDGSYLFYISTFFSYLFFTYFGVCFTQALKRKVLKLKYKLIIIIPLFILSLLDDLNIIKEKYLILFLLITTIYMLFNMIKIYRNIAEDFLKKSLRLLFIESVVLIPFIFMLFIGIFNFFSISVIYIYMLVISIESHYFTFRFLSEKPFLNRGKISDNFIQKYSLSEREKEIVQLIIDGKQNKDIADELFISVRTVTTHISNIYSKVSVKSRIQLINIFNGNWS